VYKGAKEILPTNAPRPLGKDVDTVTFHDANLYHDIITGRSVTGIIHFLNRTPIDWLSNKQNTVETSTYGSEYVASRIAIIDFRNTLRLMGIPIGRSVLFGDNLSVCKRSMRTEYIYTCWDKNSLRSVAVDGTYDSFKTLARPWAVAVAEKPR
jgi:hypothetical protein